MSGIVSVRTEIPVHIMVIVKMIAVSKDRKEAVVKMKEEREASVAVVVFAICFVVADDKKQRRNGLIVPSLFYCCFAMYYKISSNVSLFVP